MCSYGITDMATDWQHNIYNDYKISYRTFDVEAAMLFEAIIMEYKR